MADITLKLVWYRLQETVGNMAESAGRFFDLNNWDILDLFFAGWILLPLCLYFIVSYCIKVFRNVEIGRLPQNQDALRKSSVAVLQNGVIEGPKQFTPTHSGDGGCHWVNSFITWLYLHYNSTPQILDSWIRSLNEYSDRLQNDLQPRFGVVQPGSLPPKVLQVRSEAGPGEKLTIYAVVDCRELELLLYATPPRSFEEVGFCLKIQKLHGEVKTQIACHTDEVQAAGLFIGHPDLGFSITPSPQRSVDRDVISQLDELVQDVFSHAVIHFNLSSFGRFTEAFERIQKDVKSELAAPPKPPRIQDRRLLVKVMKGSSLGAREYGCTDPYCIVSMDDPSQRHTTSVVKNTINPFWDEHFLFDLNSRTQEITFELFDRDKPPEDDFLGRCVLKVDEVRRHPSLRQIIPLTGRLNKNDKVTGSITVEFLFMEPAEAQQYELDENISPRRRIETSRTMLPGGTRVTMTTTTTEKPRDRTDNTAVNESPSRVEKTERASRRSGSPSPYVDRKSSHGRERNTSASQEFVMINGVESVAETALRELTEKRHRPKTPSRTSTLVITSVQRENVKIPMIKTSEVPDDVFPGNHDESLVSTTSTDRSPSDIVKKHKSSFAKGLKKRFIRSKDKKPRSHSVERSSGIQADNLLKPPGHYSNKSQSTENLHQYDDSSLSKSKSFGGSIKRLFQRKKKNREGDISRESSISRGYQRGDGSDISRESSPPVSQTSSLTRH